MRENRTSGGRSRAFSPGRLPRSASSSVGRAAAWGLAAVMALAGCGPKKALRPQLDRHALVRDLLRSWEESSGWEGFVALSGRIRGRRVRLTEAVVARAPSSIYLEPADALAAARGVPIVAVADGELRLIWRSDRLFHKGPATPESLGRLTGQSLAAEELVALILGLGLPWADYAGAPPRGREPSGAARFSSARLGRQAKVSFDAEGRVASGEVLGADGRRAYRFEYRRDRGVREPGSGYRLRIESEEGHLELRPREVSSPSPPREPEFFHPEPPAGSRRVELGEVDGPWRTPVGARR